MRRWLQLSRRGCKGDSEGSRATRSFRGGSLNPDDPYLPHEHCTGLHESKSFRIVVGESRILIAVMIYKSAEEKMKME
jgi:hypothetical protein